MGRMANKLRQYLAQASKEQLDADWERLKGWAEVGEDLGVYWHEPTSGLSERVSAYLAEVVVPVVCSEQLEELFADCSYNAAA